MRGRRQEGPPPITVAADAAANRFPDAQCLVCGGPARAFSSREVPELVRWFRGDIGEQDLAAAVWRTHPGVEGCFVAPASGYSVCATKGVVR
jgi:hypothetical protein